MKKLFALLLVVSLLGTDCNAQNIQDNKFRFSYTQLPSHPLKGSGNQYSVNIKEGFHQRNEDSLRLFEQRMNAYQTEVNNAITNWEASKIALDKAHLQAMSQYELQVLSGNAAAQMPIKPPYPGLNVSSLPKEPLLCKSLDTDALKKGVQITGLTHVDGHAFEINLIYEGLILSAPRMTQKVSNGKTVYEYVFNYSSPVKAEIHTPKGVIFNERIAETTSQRTYKTQAFNTKSDFELWWMDNQEQVWNDLQDQAAQENTNAINGFLDNRFGFPARQFNAEIYTIKDKNFDYSEYDTAFELIRDALLMISVEGNENEIKEKLQKAIKLYKNVDVVAKRQRKDKVVNAATYINLAIAYLWLNDFTNAELSVKQAISQSINSYTRTANGLLSIIRDQKQRYEANR